MNSRKKTSSKRNFEDLKNALSKQIDELTKSEKITFDEIYHLITTSQEIIEQDCFLPIIPIQENSLLLQSGKIFNRYFKENNLTLSEMSKILDLISKHNVRQYYDQGWIHQDKTALFRDLLETLFLKFRDLLDKNTIFNTTELALTLHAFSLWEFIPSEFAKPDWVESALKSAIKLTEEPNPQSAFLLLKFIAKFHDYHLIPKSSEISTAIGKLSEIALPLLLEEEPPLVMFKEPNHLRLFRNENIMHFLPRNHPVTRAIHAFGTSSFPFFESMTPSIKESEDAVFGKKRKDGAIYYPLELQMNYIKSLLNDHHTKGLHWLITEYSKQIIGHLDNKKNRTYPISQIKDYLKLMRKCLLDINSEQIKKATHLMCQATIWHLEHHPEKFDSSLAVDLLWINLVLSSVLQDKSIAFSKDTQNMLVEFINRQETSINLAQARALFEIKTLEWTGNLAFSNHILDQMLEHHKKFCISANPSKYEEKYYHKILDALTDENKNLLHKTHICTITGHEIDIVYINKNYRIAINIDLFGHTDLTTGLTNFKTRFRDICLKKAGWIIFNVASKKLAQDTDHFDKLISTINQTSSDITPSPTVQKSGLFKKIDKPLTEKGKPLKISARG